LQTLRHWWLTAFELIFTPVLASSPGDLPAEKRGMGAWSGSREVGELSLA
jgi:hypothetical protein